MATISISAELDVLAKYTSLMETHPVVSLSTHVQKTL